MKQYLSRHAKDIMLAGVLVVCIVFIVNIIALGQEYSSDITKQAAQRAEYYTAGQALLLEKQIMAKKIETERLAASLSEAEGEEDFLSRLRREEVRQRFSDPDFKALCYFSGGALYNTSGTPVTGYPDLSALSAATGTVLSKVFQYDNIQMSVGISAASDSPFADRIVVVCDRNILRFENAFGAENAGTPECVDVASFVLLCKHDHYLLDSRVGDRLFEEGTYRIGYGSVEDGILKTLLTNSGDFAAVSDMITSSGSGSLSLRVGTEQYILTVYSFGPQNGGLYLLSMYSIASVYGDGYRLTHLIWGTLLVFSLVTAALCIIFVVRQVDIRRRITNQALQNELLDCPTSVRYAKEMKDILERNKITNYAALLLRVQNFEYIGEHFGTAAETALLRHIRNLCRNSLVIDETYGYDSGGEFWLLLHAKDRKVLTDRLNGLARKLTSYRVTEDAAYTLSVAFDIYEIDRSKNETPQHIMNCAIKVRDASLHRSGAVILNFFGDNLRQSYLRKAEIEGRMESALKKSEFHLFYQPKYNLHTGTIDGSEILVRWFDPEIDTYRKPSEFLPVFEETGFVSRMDRFVFFRACENIAERLAKKMTVYPISVNVSRVTAIQPDFVDYYKRIKEKFGVRDNFVTLEFTESFAYENYEHLARIVKELHEAGFFCSLDDFGTGYSSFVPLKMLQMDEIKLDMSFLEKGLSEETDDIILRNVIHLGRDLGIKVTQEGVGSKADFDRMAELGCDVIQGFYFAKPMKYVSYLEFVRGNYEEPDSDV